MKSSTAGVALVFGLALGFVIGFIGHMYVVNEYWYWTIPGAERLEQVVCPAPPEAGV